MKSKKPSEVKYYSDLDMPIYLWNKIHESGDLSYLLMERKQLNKSLSDKLSKVWENIYDQYFKEFGISSNLKQILSKQKEIAELRLDLILTGDGTIQTYIDIAERELESLNKQSVKSNFMQSVMAIESSFKFQIDEHKTSVRKFYTYLKELNRKKLNRN